MKLELKHITPYLPYGLKAIDKRTKEIRTVTLLHFTYDLKTVGHNHLIYNGVLLSKHLPILRPISDITDNELISFYELTSFDLELININELKDELCHMIKGNDRFQITQFQKLFEWHLDVFRLIDKGLAVSIHDVV